MVSTTRHIEAMEKINALINVRERTIKETRERLVKYGFNEEEIEDAVETALRVGLINEERFTRMYINGKTHSGWGKRKIIARLHAAGISPETIELCSDEFASKEEEYQSAMRELSKRSSRSSNPYASYMRRLVGKGYSQDIASRAVKDYLAQQTDQFPS